MEFERKPQKFISAGMALTPPDLVPAGKYPLLKNMRAYLMGSLQVRPGQTLIHRIGVGGNLVHTLKSFRDDTKGSAALFRLAGVATSLYFQTVGVGLFNLIDSGPYSGNPLTIVTFRPTQSVQPWQYIGDGSRMRKVRIDGTNYQIGIDPPITVPAVVFAAPNVVQQEAFDAVGSWVNGGTAGAIAVASRVNTTVGTIVYDTGTTGWCSINPASFDQIQTGAMFLIGVGGTQENLLVVSTSRALPATTIQSITYDTGNTGLCTIQPVAATSPSGDPGDSSSPFSETDSGGADTTGVLYPNFVPNQRDNHPVGLVQDALVTLGGTETVRVLSVNNGPTGIASFRCSTANNHVAGEACTGLTAFRCYLTNTHAAAEALSGSAFQVSISPGIGFVQNNQAYALGVVGNRPIQPTDEINISLRIDDLNKFVEAKIIFDLDPAHSYSSNFYQIDIRQNDILAGVKNSVTMASARQRAIQRRFVDQTRVTFSRPSFTRSAHGFTEELDTNDADSNFNLNTEIPVDPFTETPTGDNQWFDFRFKVGDLDRVGVDYSKGLADVQGIRVQFNASATLTASIDSLWIGGTYGPDIGDLGAPYVYRQRYRSTLTGAKSNPGPPTRSGLAAHRQRIQITGVVSGDAQVDKIDYFRWGGVVTSWIYIGSSPNSTAPFFDDFNDQDILSNPTLDFDNFAPFPVTDLPRSGVCNVAGTKVTQISGDTFNTSWGPGVVINIDGFPYTLYNQPSDAVTVEIVESAGTKSGVPWFIAEPLLLRQTMPIIFGPTEGTGFMFGLGNTLQQGTVFWCKNNDPDSAPETHQVDVVSPSESLMNGCLYGGRVIVGSIQRFFQLIPSFDQTNQYTPVELPVGKGIFTRWGFCVGPYIWFISADGIEQTDGGPAVNIAGDLYPIFPHDGQPGVVTNGVQPPSLTEPQSWRLSYCSGMLYFDFKDVTGNFATLVYDVMLKAWVSYDTYAFPVVVHYEEEEQSINAILMGDNTGRIMQLLGTTDIGSPIAFEVDPSYFDAGDSRARKLYGDVILDYNAAGDTVAVTVKADNGVSVIPSSPATVTNAARGQSVIDLNSGAGTTNRNLAPIISGNSSHGVQLFEWQPSFIIKPEDVFLRFTDWDDAGHIGAKFIQGFVIEADTGNSQRTIEIHDDTDSVQATLTVQHNGQTEKAYSFPPFITHNYRFVPKDAASWRLFKMRCIFEPMPELAVNWTTQGTTNDQQGYQHIRDGYIALISTTDVTLTVTLDGVAYTYTIASTGGVYLKRYFQVQPIKGKIVTYSLTSASGFRLFRKDCEVRVKSWNDPGGYRVVNPFGDEHRLQGAAI